MTDSPELTDAERLAAIETYIKVLEPAAKALRAKITTDMGLGHVERVGAYLPDGTTKLASVSRSEGKRIVQCDGVAALDWCRRRYPDEIETVERVRPAFLKKLLDVAGSLTAGSKGLDPKTGEELAFITVGLGNPYITVTTTDEGLARMAVLAGGFVRMLTAASAVIGEEQHDPAFADRPESGAYTR